MQTVWLKDNIICSICSRDNILFFTHKNVLELLKLEEYTLILFEPDGSVGVRLQCAETSAREQSEKSESLVKEYYFALNGNESGQGIDTAEGRLIPLRTENTSVFGALLFPGNGQTELTENKRKVICSYAEALYNEAFGGIIRSFYPEILKIRNLEIAYQKGVNIIKGIDFDICANEFTVILGSSGCGKTTTISAIGGMLSPTGGEILWNGKDIARMNDRERTAYRRNAIGFIFQNYNLISELSAAENIRVAASLVEEPMPVEEALALVGLAEKADRYPGKMSGGEQQRVCIARAIAKRPQILLCDEPTGALDPGNARLVMKTLTDLVRKQHMAVVMITHNTAFRSLADHYIVMSAGRIEEDVRQPFPLPVEVLSLH